jgi:hypothetical protein
LNIYRSYGSLLFELSWILWKAGTMANIVKLALLK